MAKYSACSYQSTSTSLCLDTREIFQPITGRKRRSDTIHGWFISNEAIVLSYHVGGQTFPIHDACSKKTVMPIGYAQTMALNLRSTCKKPTTASYDVSDANRMDGTIVERADLCPYQAGMRWNFWRRPSPSCHLRGATVKETEASELFI